jgi:subtilisin family serine protease
LFFGNNRVPVRVPSVDAEIEDMIDDGIHVCIAAGNNRYKADLPTGLDFDNEVVFSGGTYQYHRGSSPFSNEAFMVGNIDAQVNSGVDRIAGSSTRGPAINIYAPGDNIMSTSSIAADAVYSLLDYPGNSTYKIMSIGGTSMASPQVAGVCALHLQVQPDLTPGQLKDKVISDAKEVISTTGSDTDYDDYINSLLGGPNKMLYSRYGSANTWAITGTINISGGL